MTFNDQLTTQLSSSAIFLKAIGNYHSGKRINCPVIRIIHFLNKIEVRLKVLLYYRMEEVHYQGETYLIQTHSEAGRF